MAIDVRKPLKKFIPHLIAARDQNLNEADIVVRLIKVLEDVLGYDGLSEITREMNLKDKYVDLAVKIDGTVKFLIEAKSAGTELRDRHIEQAERYAAENNIRWVLLTNGTVWNLYHLTFDEGIEYARAFSVDITTDFDQCAECIGLLHRTSVRNNGLDDSGTIASLLVLPSSVARVRAPRLHSTRALNCDGLLTALMRHDFRIEIARTILFVIRVRNFSIDHSKSRRFDVDVAILVVVFDRSINARQNRESSSPKTAAARVSGHHQQVR